MKITVETILNMNPCEPRKKVFLDSLGKYTMKTKVSIEHIIEHNCKDSFYDILWVLYRLPDDYIPEIKEKRMLMCNEFAYLCLENFENVYPEDKRPRQALEAVENFIYGKITTEQLLSAAAAADSAAAAASADSADSARSAAWSAADSAASAAAASARSAAWSAAWSAADSARSAAWSAADSASDSASAAAWYNIKAIIIKYFGESRGRKIKIKKLSNEDIVKKSIKKNKKIRTSILIDKDKLEKAKKNKISISKLVNNNL